MAIEAGRVGVKSNQVNALGEILGTSTIVDLWVNPNKAATQGTVNISLSDNINNYDYLEITARMYSSTTTDLVTTFIINVKEIFNKTFKCTEFLANGKIGTRTFTILSDTTMRISASGVYETYGVSDTTQSTTTLIIGLIRGIKIRRD